jgi:hypothetical protein
MAAKIDPPSEAKIGEAASKAGEEAAARLSAAATSYGGAFATSVKAAQDYQTKLFHFLQENLEANVAFTQKLAGTRTPADFVQVATAHTRERAEALSQQAKELAELAQEASKKTFEALSAPKR